LAGKQLVFLPEPSLLSSGMAIRKAEVADIPYVYDLLKTFSVFIGTPEKVKVTADQLISDGDLFKCLVAEEDGKVIGYAAYYFAYYSWTGKAIYLDDLYVTDEYRSRGIGSLLFDAVAELGKQEGCHKMQWQVSKWNNNAIEFYKRKGAAIDDVECNAFLKF
jgi:GNAT superfamily N-acetyltransferase